MLNAIYTGFCFQKLLLSFKEMNELNMVNRTNDKYETSIMKKNEIRMK